MSLPTLACIRCSEYAFNPQPRRCLLLTNFRKGRDVCDLNDTDCTRRKISTYIPKPVRRGSNFAAPSIQYLAAAPAGGGAPVVLPGTQVAPAKQGNAAPAANRPSKATKLQQAKSATDPADRAEFDRSEEEGIRNTRENNKRKRQANAQSQAAAQQAAPQHVAAQQNQGQYGTLQQATAQSAFAPFFPAPPAAAQYGSVQQGGVQSLGVPSSQRSLADQGGSSATQGAAQGTFKPAVITGLWRTEEVIAETEKWARKSP